MRKSLTILLLVLVSICVLVSCKSKAPKNKSQEISVDVPNDEQKVQTETHTEQEQMLESDTLHEVKRNSDLEQIKSKIITSAVIKQNVECTFKELVDTDVPSAGVEVNPVEVELSYKGDNSEVGVFKGLFVHSIYQNSNATKAGLGCGDVIIKVNGIDVVDAQKFCDIIKILGVGGNAKVELFGYDKGFKTIEFDLNSSSEWDGNSKIKFHNENCTVKQDGEYTCYEYDVESALISAKNLMIGEWEYIEDYNVIPVYKAIVEGDVLNLDAIMEDVGEKNPESVVNNIFDNDFLKINAYLRYTVSISDKSINVFVSEESLSKSADEYYNILLDALVKHYGDELDSKGMTAE